MSRIMADGNVPALTSPEISEEKIILPIAAKSVAEKRTGLRPEAIRRRSGAGQRTPNGPCDQSQAHPLWLVVQDVQRFGLWSSPMHSCKCRLREVHRPSSFAMTFALPIFVHRQRHVLHTALNFYYLLPFTNTRSPPPWTTGCMLQFRQDVVFGRDKRTPR
jgi:hypothetical protein